MEIRCSTLSGYADCPRRSACRLIHDEIIGAGFSLRDESRGIGATIGTSVHSGAFTTMEMKIKTGGEPCSEAQAIDSSMATYDEQAVDVSYDSTTPDKSTGEKQVIRQTKAFYHIVAPKIIPVKAEDRMKASIGKNFILSGQPDVITADKAIRDLKCGSVARDCRAQVGGYGILASSNEIPADKAVQDFIKRVRVSKEQAPPEENWYDLEMSKKVAWNVLKKIIKDCDEFKTTKNPWSFLSNPMSMLCSRKYCTASKDWCEYATGKKFDVI